MSGILSPIEHLFKTGNPGEVVSVERVGESGSGKSIFGRVINSLLPPSKGEMIFGGKRLDPNTGARTMGQRRFLQALLGFLLRLHRETGIAHLFITHDLNIVRSIASRVAILHSGTIIRQGEMYEVLSPPFDSYTKRLLDAVPTLEPS